MVSKINLRIQYTLIFDNFIKRPYFDIPYFRFEHITINNSPETGSDEDALRYQIKVIQLIRADLQKAIDYYDKLFIK